MMQCTFSAMTDYFANLYIGVGIAILSRSVRRRSSGWDKEMRRLRRRGSSAALERVTDQGGHCVHPFASIP